MDRLETASQPLSVETKYGVFTFRRPRILDYPKIEARVRRAYVDAGYLGPADSIATLQKAVGTDAQDGVPTDSAVNYLLVQSAARLDVLAESKPEGFGSWLDVDDVDEVLRVAGEVQKWLDSFRNPVRAEGEGLGSQG